MQPKQRSPFPSVCYGFTKRTSGSMLLSRTLYGLLPSLATHVILTDVTIGQSNTRCSFSHMFHVLYKPQGISRALDYHRCPEIRPFVQGFLASQTVARVEKLGLVMQPYTRCENLPTCVLKHACRGDAMTLLRVCAFLMYILFADAFL